MKSRFRLSAFGLLTLTLLGIGVALAFSSSPLAQAWGPAGQSTPKDPSVQVPVDTALRNLPDRTLLTATFTPRDEDGDGYFEALVMKTMVPLPRPGDYSASLELLTPDSSFPDGTRLIARGRPPGHLEPITVPRSVALRSAHGDSAALVAWFDGEEIRTCPTSTPWYVQVILDSSSPHGGAGAFFVPVQPLNPRRFGNLSAYIVDVGWNPDDRATHPLVVTLDVARPGQFQLTARLNHWDTTVGRAFADTTLQPGSVEIQVPWFGTNQSNDSIGKEGSWIQVRLDGPADSFDYDEFQWPPDSVLFKH